MNRLVLIAILAVAGCTHSDPAPAPEVPKATLPPPETVPAIRRAGKTLEDATDFAAKPTIDTEQAIRTLELAARLRNDIHKARRHGTHKALQKVDQDVKALDRTMQQAR